MTTLYIKNLVEKISGIEDIGIRNRKRNISDARHIYFALCRKFSEEPLETVALTVNLRHHATVISGLKRFYWLENQKCYKHNKETYKKCYKILLPLLKMETAKDYNMTNVIKNNQIILGLEERVKKIKRINFSLIKGMNVEFELVT